MMECVSGAGVDVNEVYMYGWLLLRLNDAKICMILGCRVGEKNAYPSGICVTYLNVWSL